jgi:nucleotide-binding universal stress UspA family protein
MPPQQPDGEALRDELRPRTIVVLHGSDAASTRAVCRAAAVAEAAGARLVVVVPAVAEGEGVPLEPAAAPLHGAPFVPRSSEPDDEARERRAEEARRLAGDTAELVEAPDSGLGAAIEVAHGVDADLLVVGAGGRSLLGRLLGPDPDDPAVGDLGCDLLVVHDPSAPAGGFAS